MKINNNKYLLYPFSTPINIINNIKFSAREMDILACVVGGRTAKKIASFLYISPRTVENYIRNLTLKLECNSRESLIDFIEKYDKLFLIKKHYSNLLIQAEFEKGLNEISRLSGQSTLYCLLICEEKQAPQKSFLSSFQKHLKLVGVTITIELKQRHSSFSQDIVELQVEKDPPVQTSPFSQRILFLFLEKGDNKDVLRKLPEFGDRDVIIENNYYFLVFNVIKKLFPELNFERTISDFKEKYKNLSSLYGDIQPQTSPEELQLDNKENKNKIKILYFLKKRKWYFILGVFILLILNIRFSSIMFLNSQAGQEKTSKQNFTPDQSQKQQKEPSIRSDLNIPAKSALLDRTELIAQIKDTFKNEQGIQALALVGPGGAGKTTLARQYVALQKANVIWELNAETNECLKSSFENLAQALAKTNQDQQILRVIQETKDPEKKEGQVIAFVKERLHAYSNWFLIYDNVEKFTDIKKYFPQDPQTWGEGKIILTTRNSNIQHNKHILSTIQVGELTPNQKLALFTKIMREENTDSFSSLQLEETREFLEKLPAFPLDISIAAYYLRAINVSYATYLTTLAQNNKDFKNVQEELLKEAGDYTNSRYGIITLSLQHIIDAHKDFKDLFLLIVLLDSQNIPRELLERYKEKGVVNNFIYILKKYSLIINDSVSLLPGKTFSIHRSTREISLAYLTKKLNLEESTHLVQPIVDILVNYMVELIDEEDVSRMKSWIPHGEIFLSHNKLLNDTMQEAMRNELGRIYCDLAYFIKAKSFFEENIIKSNKKHINPYTARALTELGGVYRELGNYEKAKNLLQKSVLVYKNHLPENQRDKAYAFLYLGFVYANLGDYEKAKNLLEESLSIYKNYFPEKYAYGVRNFASLGNTYRALGNYEEAKNLLEQGLTLCRKHLSQDHMELALTVGYLGVINEEIGHDEEAKNLLEQCLGICKKHFSENHLMIGQAAMLLGNAYIAVGQYAKAKSLLEQSLKVFQQYYPEKHIFNVRVLISLGKTYTKLNDYEKAKSLLEKSLKIYVNNFDENNIETTKILGALGQVYFLEDQLNDAENFFVRALAIFQKNNHPNVYMAFEDLADLFLKKAKNEEDKGNFILSQNFKAKALAYLKQAQETVEKRFPKDSPHITRIQSKITSVSEQ